MHLFTAFKDFSFSMNPLSELRQSCGEFVTAKTRGCVGRRVLQVLAVIWPHGYLLDGLCSISAWSVFHMLAYKCLFLPT